MQNRIELASQFIGFSEKRNHNELQKLLRMNPTRNQWCASFVTAIERLAGERGTGVLAARAYLNYGTEVKIPKPGDIVILWRGARDSYEGHVGYLIEKGINSVTILGGNQDHQVKIKKYPRERVLGYRRIGDPNLVKPALSI